MSNLHYLQSLEETAADPEKETVLELEQILKITVTQQCHLMIS